MNRVIKKAPDISETLTEKTKPKGASISIYLNAESLQFLDRLAELYKKGRSEIIQEMIVNQQRSISFVLPFMIDSFGLSPDKKDEVKEKVRKIAGL